MWNNKFFQNVTAPLFQEIWFKSGAVVFFINYHLRQYLWKSMNSLDNNYWSIVRFTLEWSRSITILFSSQFYFKMNFIMKNMNHVWKKTIYLRFLKAHYDSIVGIVGQQKIYWVGKILWCNKLKIYNESILWWMKYYNENYNEKLQRFENNWVVWNNVIPL